MAKENAVTVEITRGTSTVRVRGSRSTRGWNVYRVDGALTDFQGTRKEKDKAIQLALDCCGETPNATFLVKPVDK